MKIVSIAIVVILGGLLIVHYYRQYYNYTNHINSTTWPCEIDELGNCVKEIKTNKCPDYWQHSSDPASVNSAQCKNVHNICPATNLNCKNSTSDQSEENPFTTSDSVSLETKCNWSRSSGYSWDGVCGRHQFQHSNSDSSSN